MRSLNYDLRVVYAITTVMFIASYWIHLPAPFGSIDFYSDITHLYNLIFQGRGWFKAVSVYGLPYVDYFLEYPVIIGLCFALSSLPRIVVKEPLGELIFYHIMTLILYVATIFTVRELYKILSALNISSTRILLYLSTTVSFLLYVVYNWDIIASAFTVLSLRLFIEKRYNVSSVCLGLAVSTKIIPGALIVPILIQLRKVKLMVKYVLITMLTYLTLHAPIMIANFNSWLMFWNYHLSWFIEDSWLQLIFDIYDPRVKYASIVIYLLLAVPTIMLVTKYKHKDDTLNLIENSFVFLAITLFSSYVFTPQMSLLLYPLITLLPITSIALFYTYDILNAAIMIYWGTVNEWLKTMLGYEIPLLARESPISIISSIRCFILLALTLMILRSRLKTKRNTVS